MQNNRTLVYGNLYGIPNVWERKYKPDQNTYELEYPNNKKVFIKELFNTYLLQTDIEVDNSYLEYFIFLATDTSKEIRNILKEDDSKLKDHKFYFDCRIETFRNPPYLSFKNAILVNNQEQLDQYEETDLFTSTIECDVFKHNLSGEDGIYNFMLVKTINEENYNNPLKIHYLNPKVAKKTGKQVFKTKIVKDKLILAE